MAADMVEVGERTDETSYAMIPNSLINEFNTQIDDEIPTVDASKLSQKELAEHNINVFRRIKDIAIEKRPNSPHYPGKEVSEIEVFLNDTLIFLTQTKSHRPLDNLLKGINDPDVAYNFVDAYLSLVRELYITSTYRAIPSELNFGFVNVSGSYSLSIRLLRTFIDLYPEASTPNAARYFLFSNELVNKEIIINSGGSFLERHSLLCGRNYEQIAELHNEAEKNTLEFIKENYTHLDFTLRTLNEIMLRSFYFQIYPEFENFLREESISDPHLFIRNAKVIFGGVIREPDGLENEMSGLFSKISQEIELYKGNEAEIRKIAVHAYTKIINIHPFIDGNGTFAQNFIHFIMSKGGFPQYLDLSLQNTQEYLGKKHTGKVLFALGIPNFLSLKGARDKITLLLFLRAQLPNWFGSGIREIFR